MVIDYIEKCEMGFELVGVTITSHRVLSLIASLVVGFIFAFGSTIANALDPSAADGATPTADELSALLGTRVTLHPVVSSRTLQGLILDSISAKAPREGLHFAIAHSSRDPNSTVPLPPTMAGDIDHHFLAVWHTRLDGPATVS